MNTSSKYSNTKIAKSYTSPVQVKLQSLEPFGTIGKYKIIKQFESNHLNPVFLVQSDDLKNGLYVIKTLELNDKSFANETRVINLPSHPNIVTCQEVLTSIPVELDFNINIRNAIVLEHATNGDLFPYLVHGPLPMSICRYYFEQLLDSVDHLHENKCCHLDIKPENLLLDYKFNFKLCDFGYTVPYTEKNGIKLVKTSCGTSTYFPPEVWEAGAIERGYDGTKADIFQCGLILFIMLTGQPPFEKSLISDAWFSFIARERWDEFWFYKEKGVNPDAMGAEDQFFSPELRELFRRMLNSNPSERPTAKEIKESAWYTETFPAQLIEVQFEMFGRKVIKN